jgi:hypothetical protein
MANSRLGLGWNQVPVERRTSQNAPTSAGSVMESMRKPAMLSLFDCVVGCPAVEDDQRHENLVLVPHGLRQLLERCPVSTLERPSCWFALAQWWGCWCGAADRDAIRIRRNRGCVCIEQGCTHANDRNHWPSSLLLPAPVRHTGHISGVRRLGPVANRLESNEHLQVSPLTEPSALPPNH